MGRCTLVCPGSRRARHLPAAAHPIPSRDKMYVGVHDSLSRTRSTVHPDIETRDCLVGCLNSVTQNLNQTIGIFLLFGRHREEVRRVTQWKDQHIAHSLRGACP